MNKIKDIAYVHRQTGESLSVCKNVYEKNGCNVELTLRELYQNRNKTDTDKEKIDVSCCKANFEKKNERRKTTKIVLKSIVTVVVVALIVFLFYRAVTLVNPIWLALFILLIASLSLILFKLWLPPQVWKAMQQNDKNAFANDHYQPTNHSDDDCCNDDDCYSDDNCCNDNDDQEPQSFCPKETLFDILFNDKTDDDATKKADEEEWEESCENCGEYYDDCECDDCGDEDCENW